MKANIEIDLQVPLDDLYRQFAGGERKLTKAIDRAIRKTITWIKRQLVKSVAAEAKIPQKALKSRTFSSVNKKEKVGVVWLGLNPIGAHLVGKPRQVRRGVRIGRKHFFENAFYKKVFGNVEKVWRRKFRGPGSSKRGRGDGRFPVEVMLIQLESIGEQAAEKINNQARSMFIKILKAEINYEFFVKGR